MADSMDGSNGGNIVFSHARAVNTPSSRTSHFIPGASICPYAQ